MKKINLEKEFEKLEKKVKKLVEDANNLYEYVTETDFYGKS